MSYNRESRKGQREMRKKYPSDISREQFEEIREELANAKKKTHPRSYDIYDIFCAVLYLGTAPQPQIFWEASKDG